MSEWVCGGQKTQVWGHEDGEARTGTGDGALLCLCWLWKGFRDCPFLGFDRSFWGLGGGGAGTAKGTGAECRLIIDN